MNIFQKDNGIRGISIIFCIILFLSANIYIVRMTTQTAYFFHNDQWHFLYYYIAALYYVAKILCLAIILLSILIVFGQKKIILSTIAVILIVLSCTLNYYSYQHLSNRMASTAMHSAVVVEKDMENNQIVVQENDQYMRFCCTNTEMAVINIGDEFGLIMYNYRVDEPTVGYIEEVVLYD